MNNFIKVKNAKVHNLKSVSLEIPKNKLVIFTGLSGSGKSSLAFDTLYAEGQRKYVESLNTYARQFLGMASKPNVESIEGLSPAISIEQKNSNYNPRSTVGTITEIYDYLRVMFARVGSPFCINGHGLIQSKTKNQIFNEINIDYDGKNISLLAPIIVNKKGSHKDVLLKLKKEGFLRVNVDNEIRDLYLDIILEKNVKHNIEILVDRFLLTKDDDTELRLTEAIEACSKYSNGIILVKNIKGDKEHLYSEKYSCIKCDYAIPELEPRLFSFNSPIGACEQCQGLGVIFSVNKILLFNYDKSILEGGVEYFKNLINTKNMMWQEFSALINFYSIPLDVKIKNLSTKQIDIILNGSKEPIKYMLESSSGINKYNKYDYIEGIGRKIERLYNETTSESALSYYKSFMSETLCTSCNGYRLNKKALSILVNNKSIGELCNLSIENILFFLNKIKITKTELKILENLLNEVKSRIFFLIKVGVEYLTLSRSSNSLSGGEFQRIRLATQIGTKLTGVLYVLDEPSIGLHQRDNLKLIESLKSICELGNTLIVVEHDEEIILQSDHIVDIGPKAGVHGGRIIDEGAPEWVMKNGKGITSQYLRGEKFIKRVRKIRKKNNNAYIQICGATENNLKNLNVKIPINLFVCVTGVSGSGKSTLINDILNNGLKQQFGMKVPWVGKHTKIINNSRVDKVIAISQKPIGKTSRSNPATYIGVFLDIRELFANTMEAKARGYNLGRFSFNVASGRCQKCQGAGKLRISMLFMADIFIECDECIGKKYKQEVLQVYFKDKNISDVLEMTVDEAIIFFEHHNKIMHKLKILSNVGLGYIKLNQPSPYLSGGEAQRVKLAFHLLKKSTGNTLYIFDEPTTGLHFDDIKKLILILNSMVDRGDSVLVIEHNLDIVKVCDYIIDLGPEGGEKGGEVVATGNPNQMVDKDTFTGFYLKLKYNLDENKLHE